MITQESNLSIYRQQNTITGIKSTHWQKRKFFQMEKYSCWSYFVFFVSVPLTCEQYNIKENGIGLYGRIFHESFISNLYFLLCNFEKGKQLLDF